MKKSNFFKCAVVATAALWKQQKTMALALLMLSFMGGYANAQDCDTPSINNLIQLGITSTSGGGWGILNGDFTNPGNGGYWQINRSSGNYININLALYGGNTCMYLLGDPIAGSGAIVELGSWHSSTGFGGSPWITIDITNYIPCSKYYFVLRGWFSSGNMKMTCGTTPIYPQLSSQADEDGPKIVNLVDLVSPIAGQEGMESFPFLYLAASAWGDFNNDGFLDVMISGASHYELDGDSIGIPHNNIPEGAVSIKHTFLYKNNGDGTFTQVEHSFPNFDTGGIAWLDYDNDGNLDVFIAGNTDNGRYSGLWRNLGNGEFEDAFPGTFEYFDIEGGMRPSRVIAVGDYDNDGWIDLAFIGRKDGGEEARMVSLYKNLEGEDFLKVTNPVRGEKPFVQQNGGSIAWGDYNRDGLLDLICFGWISGTDDQKAYYTGDDFAHYGACSLYTNNGDGTFSEPWIFPAGEDGQVAWNDYNNDGKLDFALAHYSWWSEPNNGWRFDLYENKGNSAFTQHNSEATGFPGTQTLTMDWGDINSDGYEDVVADHAGPSAVFLNNFGNGTFLRKDILFETADPDFPQLNIFGGTTSFVDFDNDGDLDIFINGKDDWSRQNTRSYLLRNDLDVEEGLPVNQAPSAPANLQATTDDEGFTVFTWDASTDDLTPQIALRYNLYVKQGNSIKSVLPADLTTGRLKVNETLAPIIGTTYKMSGIEGDYEWGVQAIDNAKNASIFTKKGGTNIVNVNKISLNVIGHKNAVEVRAANSLYGTLNIYSISGANLYAKSGQLNGTRVELQAGVYLVKAVSSEGVVVKKVTVK
ncbi:MAG: VCBS repeat-containing protein [Tannerellaceae bacterium]|jgi:hypothetical protein|nr:VCBS repeat-containing protein [Tannerellaceae bacterium]